MKEKILSFIKNHREETMFYTILVLPIAFLPLIYSLSPHSFILDGKFAWIKMVDYYIELLAAVGAAFLGLIATLQNQRLQNLEERADNRANSCNIYIKNHLELNDKVEEFLFEFGILDNESTKKYQHDWQYIGLDFENFSDAFLREIQIFFGDNEFKNQMTLVKGNIKNNAIMLPKNLEEDKEYKCEIIFTSCYNVKSYGDFSIYIPKKPKEGYNKLYIDNYHFYGTEKPKN